VKILVTKSYRTKAMALRVADALNRISVGRWSYLYEVEATGKRQWAVFRRPRNEFGAFMDAQLNR
jgi:hypothetical protein